MWVLDTGRLGARAGGGFVGLARERVSVEFKSTQRQFERRCRSGPRASAASSSARWSGVLGESAGGVGESVGVGPGLDDGSVERQPVDDRGAQSRVGERLRPSGYACRGVLRGARRVYAAIACRAVPGLRKAAPARLRLLRGNREVLCPASRSARHPLVESEGPRTGEPSTPAPPASTPATDLALAKI